MVKHKAVLIIGPTGCGKTPFGACLEKNGWDGMRCQHFDFGDNLRAVSDVGSCPGLTDEDIEIIHEVLETGALFDDEQFYIPKTILKAFLEGSSAGDDSLVILNGLPRHEGQARAVADIVDVERLVRLDCTAEIVKERIQKNSGGDRRRRRDDSLRAIERKLQIYAERTEPLVRYYESNGIPVAHVEIGGDTSPADIVAQLA